MAIFPLTPPAAAPVTPAAAADTSGAVSAIREFLGFGLLRPFRRDGTSDWASAGGVALVQSAVGQILGTKSDGGSVRGELPWRPEFGSKLHLLRHRNNDLALQELARIHVVDALRRWEPRVRVTRVNFIKGQVPDRQGQVVLFIEVRYDIISENVAGNNVLVRDAAALVPLL